VDFSIAGIGGALPASSRFIASLKVPSTITTTLAPTSSERILDVTDDGCFVPSLAASLALAFSAFAERRLSGSGCTALAACAARRAAAMKLEEETGGFGAAEISLIASSDAAMRSDGEAARAPGRVPGSSG